MPHPLRATVFVTVRVLRLAARWLRTALALVGAVFIGLIAMDPDPVARDAMRRARRIHGWITAVPATPPGPPLDTPPIHWPADSRRVSSGFGPRVHPITGQTRHHRGVDVPMPVGTPIRAARPGTVTRIAEDPLNGRYLVLEDPDAGLRFAYAHLSSTDVAVGAAVQAGDVLGRSGNTGRSTGPHLHFGAWVAGRAVDPRRLRTVGPGGGSVAHAGP